MTDTKKDTKAEDKEEGGKVRGQDLENPPVIPSYERELAEASALGDTDLIADISARYTEARADKAERQAKAEADAKKGDGK